VSARGSNRRRSVVAAALALAGCSGPLYELQGARAKAPGAPLTAEVRSVECWRSCDLDAPLFVELELRNDDAARALTTAPPRLAARSLWGGPTFELALTEIDGMPPEEAMGRSAYWSAGATGPTHPVRRAVPPGATLKVRLRFAADGEAPVGPYRLTLVEQVDGTPPFEVPLSDPPAGPRWAAQRAPIAGYVSSSFAGVGSGQRRGFFAMEPIGTSLRLSFGRLVLGFDVRYSFLFRTTMAVGGSSFGGSALVSLGWQPWTWHLAPYVQGGSYGGLGDASRAGSAGLVSSPRASAGVLWSFGPRLGSRTDVPVDRPMSPQRLGGLRLAYTHWFRTGDSGGDGGFEMSLELGWPR
jgi:hypothetical protein